MGESQNQAFINLCGRLIRLTYLHDYLKYTTPLVPKQTSCLLTDCQKNMYQPSSKWVKFVNFCSSKYSLHTFFPVFFFLYSLYKFFTCTENSTPPPLTPKESQFPRLKNIDWLNWGEP